MTITVCRSIDRVTAAVMRSLDGDQRRLIIQVPWRQRPSETYQAVRDQLTSEEAVALAAAFDLDQPGGAS
jgi:hypothetical protein